MRILENNYRPMTERPVECDHCKSKLSITDLDITKQQGEHVALCPCCQRHFPAMTEAEATAAFHTVSKLTLWNQ